MTKEKDEWIEKSAAASNRFGIFADMLMGYISERMQGGRSGSEPEILRFLQHAPWRDPSIACLAVLTAMMSTKPVEEVAQFTGIPLDEMQLAIASCQAVVGMRLLSVDEQVEALGLDPKEGESREEWENRINGMNSGVVH